MAQLRNALRWGIVLSMVLATIATVSTPAAADVAVFGSTTVVEDETTLSITVWYTYYPIINTNASADIEVGNKGNETATLRLTLFINGSARDTSTITVSPNTTKKTELNARIKTEKPRSIQISNYTFSSDQPDKFGEMKPVYRAPSYDFNNDDRINLVEVQMAIDDFIGGKFSWLTMLDIIDRWASGRPA